MAKNIGKILLSNALPKRKARINLGGTNITSMDFGTYKILHSSLLMPKDSISTHIAHNVRLSGMIAPTIGKCDLTIKSFFVPLRCAWEGAQPLLNKLPWYTSTGPITPIMPSTTNTKLASLFTTFAGFNGSNIDYEFVSVHETSTQQPSYVPCAGLGTTINSINSAFLFNPLTEVIGCCDGLAEDGSLTNFKPVASTIAIGSRDFIPVFGEKIAKYHGKDYDFIGLTTPNRLNTSDAYDKVHYAVQHWQFNPSSDEVESYDNACPTTVLNPSLSGRYCVFRFTALGKRVYDFLINLGYSINFSAPYFKADYKIDDTRSTTITSANVKCYYNTGLHRYTGLTKGSITGNITATTEGISADTNAQTETTLDRSETSYPQAFMGYLYTIGSSNLAADDTKMNMLPIYSFWRIYLDHLCPMQYYKTWATYYEYFMHLNGSNGIGMKQLLKIADCLTTTYDKDYFTTAWEQPNAPTTDTQENVGFDVGNGYIKTADADSADVASDTLGESYDIQDNVEISGLGLRLLNALTKYRRLINVSGQRSVDRMLARFGVRPSDERVNRAEFVGTTHSQFDISLVMSQAQTDGANLGDYVAHGESRNSGNLGKYTATEWGYYLIVAWITPSAKYVQGRTRQNLYITADDFMAPEIDEIDAMQAIRQDELYADCRDIKDVHKGSLYSMYKPNGTFGYTRMYGEMKVGRDILSGDFRLDSRGKYSNESFHLCRMLPDITERVLFSQPLVNNNDFNICKDAYQYDRIFQYDGVDYDHFFCYFKIDVDCTRNTKSITDFTMNDENDDTRMTSTEMFGHQEH